MPTKEELERELAEARAEIEAKESELDALRQGHALGVGGWLVTTPNATYTGYTSGVFFRSGRAFIPETRPQAEHLSVVLSNDFGYKSQRLTASEVGDMLRGAEGEMTDSVADPNLILMNKSVG